MSTPTKCSHPRRTVPRPFVVRDAARHQFIAEATITCCLDCDHVEGTVAYSGLRWQPPASFQSTGSDIEEQARGALEAAYPGSRS